MIARAIRQLALLLMLALVPASISGFAQLQWGARQPLKEGEVDGRTVQSWGDKVQWVDARSRERFEAGHIEGAILLNEDDWETLVPAFLDAWEPEKKVVVYCDGGSCDASHAVAARLRNEMQLPEVYVLKGGLAEWRSR